MTMKRLLTGTAIATVLSFAAAQGAYATPYAQALNQVTGISITPSSGSFTVESGATETVQTNANYNGASASHIAMGAIDTTVDAAQATAGPGPFPGENNFSPRAGFNLGMVGGRGDGLITGGTAGTVDASNVAEVRGGPGASLGSGTGQNAASIKFSVKLDSSAQITISFSDLIYLEAMTTLAGESATSTIHNDFTIRNSSGAIVFEFDPLGVTGGTATSEPFGLQTTANSIGGVPADQVISNSGFFSATSDTLSAGTYTIAIISSSNAIESSTPVPEPASLTLLGAGLLGLGLLRRRRAN